ncbi:MAG: hypothetical protein LJE68_16770 [Rhodobacter sp.]|nr:hypothetical protein [Rhodobacter sp.]
MKQIFAVFILLQAFGCVPASIDHFQSQQRLEDGIARKIAAETAAREASQGAGAANGGPDAPLPDSVQSTRLALAQDARRDYAQATGALRGGEPADRISLLLTAAQKSLYAGREADTGLVTDIRDAGAAQCASAGPARPPRDCDLLMVLPLMAALQQKRDVIFDIGVGSAFRQRAGGPILVGNELALLADAVSDMQTGAAGLVTGSAAVRQDVRDLVRTWQRDFWCAGATAMTLMSNAGGAGTAATKLLADSTGSVAVTSDLQSALSGSGTMPESLRGDYARYTSTISGAYGLPGGLSADASFFNHARQCNK